MSKQKWPSEFRHERITQVKPVLDNVTRWRGGEFFWHNVSSIATMWRYRADLIHFPANICAIYAPKQVVTVHDVIPLARWEYNWTPVKRLRRLRYRALGHAYRHAQAISAVSQFTAEELRQHVRGCAPITVVYNGVDESLFKPAADAADTRGRLDSRLLDPYILYVGGAEKRKNIEGAVAAYLRTSAEFRSQCRFCVIGNIKTLPNMLRQALLDPKLGERFIQLSFVEAKELRAIYQGARLLVYPSLYEGFGLPPLEAMASKVPVVASNRTSIPEVCGEHARLVDPEDIDSMAIAIETEATSPDAQALSAAALHARSFSWDRTADGVFAIYQRVLQSK